MTRRLSREEIEAQRDQLLATLKRIVGAPEVAMCEEVRIGRDLFMPARRLIARIEKPCNLGD